LAFRGEMSGRGGGGRKATFLQYRYHEGRNCMISRGREGLAAAAAGALQHVVMAPVRQKNTL
jgi:hypothetical protein